MSGEKNIAIVGGGPVGSLMSLYLTRRGYNVSVFERRSDMRRKNVDIGRSINLALSNRGIRALDEVGLAEQLKATAVPMHGRVMHDPKGNLSFQPYGKQGQFINSVSRGGLNLVLLAEAEKRDVSFFFEHRCQSVDFANTEIVFQVNGKTLRKKFDIILGADGAFSAVRGSMQITDRFNYAQHYVEHGYKEFHIPAGDNGTFRLEKNALHIWPRESFMLIALPNPDGSFTCTLFFPFEGKTSFGGLQDPDEFISFFETTFPDAAALMPALKEDLQTNPTSSLVTIKCYPWKINKTMVIGDAAHAIVPFYGQGMNAGFEDCRILNQLLDHHHDNWDEVIPAFQQLRKKDTDAIGQLALDNFIEMRDLVADADFLLRKKIEAKLHELYPDKWIPQYSMVTFHDEIPYSEAYRIGQRQKKIMDEVMQTPGIELQWSSLHFQDLVRRIAED